MKFNIKKILVLFISICLFSCGEDLDDNLEAASQVTFKFSHNWDGELVTNSNFNTIQYTNENGETLNIERLRYLISDLTFTGSDDQIINLDVYNLVDVTNDANLSYITPSEIPNGTYTISFTFGLDDEDNAENHLDLNSESFNVPDMLGGGYHYMQFDGKFINSNSEEQGFNYHTIRAVDNPGTNPKFPQDTFFTVNLGTITIFNTTEIEVKMNIAEWFKNPTQWNLNDFNQTLMPNSSAQIMMFDNGQNVFSLGEVTP